MIRTGRLVLPMIRKINQARFFFNMLYGACGVTRPLQTSISSHAAVVAPDPPPPRACRTSLHGVPGVVPAPLPRSTKTSVAATSAKRPPSRRHAPELKPLRPRARAIRSHGLACCLRTELLWRGVPALGPPALPLSARMPASIKTTPTLGRGLR